jgi:hypothetical protein
VTNKEGKMVALSPNVSIFPYSLHQKANIKKKTLCLESTIESESQQNADIEEEETDKLLKKDHNDSVEEALRQRKGSQKKEGEFFSLKENFSSKLGIF